MPITIADRGPGSIWEIADQTNLLALNAAIEASVVQTRQVSDAQRRLKTLATERSEQVSRYRL